jgi:hypothetical protein
LEKEPRKASEVLLEVESKLDTVLALLQSHDLTNKIISNKLSALLDKLNSQPPAPPQITVEAVNTYANAFNQSNPVDPDKTIPVSSDDRLPVEEAPNGFRRTSRPETYSGDNSYRQPVPKKQEEVKYPTQIPRANGKSEVVVPPAALNRETGQVFPPPPSTPTNQDKQASGPTHNVIPVTQRVVDATGKSAFLADVEVTDLSTMQSVFKTRTNGTGKWSAPLQVGTYRVVIRKRESLTKEKLEAAQDIQIDGLTSPFELPLMIIKK